MGRKRTEEIEAEAMPKAELVRIHVIITKEQAKKLRSIANRMTCNTSYLVRDMLSRELKNWIA